MSDRLGPRDITDGEACLNMARAALGWWKDVEEPTREASASVSRAYLEERPGHPPAYACALGLAILSQLEKGNIQLMAVSFDKKDESNE